jgi:hypothetical protein
MAAPEQSADRVRLTLRPLPGFGGEPYRRLARALKALRRAYGWAVVTGEQVPARDTPVNAPALRQGLENGENDPPTDP